MLTVVKGRAGSGKSEYCLKEAVRAAEGGLYCYIVVPEQSSFACERALASLPEGEWKSRVFVRSFSRICRDIFARAGGGARKRVSEAQKHALVRRALEALGGEIVLYRRCARDAAFFELMAGAVDELKNAAVEPEALKEAALEAKTENSRAKLRELAIIYEKYEEFLEALGLDGALELESAARLCESSRCFEGTKIFLDGFSGFTEPELVLIKALMRQCDLHCTLCCPSGDEHPDFFTAEKATLRRLLQTAREQGLARPALLELGEPSRFKAGGLKSLEAYLAGEEARGDSSEGLFCFEGADIYEECARAAAEICFLARERGFRFSEIAVITRDLSRYRSALEKTFERYGLPYFTDEPLNMLHSRPVRFILAALELASSFSSERAMTLLKTGLFNIAEASLGELESYAFVHQPKAAEWFAPFERSPEDFGKPRTAAQKEALSLAEGARAAFIGEISPFLSEAKTARGAALVSAVYSLFESCGAQAKLENEGGEALKEASAAALILEELYAIALNESLSAAELGELARTLARHTPLSDIPPSLEQVSIGQADRCRPNAPRAVFVLGLNDGLFPPASFDSPLLTQAERELLIRRGVRLGRDVERCEEMERVYLYRALCCASERVYLSSARRSGGGALERAAWLEDFLTEIPAAAPESEAEPCFLAASFRSAKREFLCALERGDEAAAALLEAAQGELSALRQLGKAPRYEIRDKRLAAGLVGNELALSPTRLESFYQCRFAYFLRYILRIRPLKKAEFSPIEAGSFIHALMESVLKAFGGDISEASDEELFSACDSAAEGYLSERLAGEAREEGRLGYLLGRLKNQGRRLLLQLRLEQRQSEFRAEDFELKVAKGGDIEPILLKTPEGGEVYVEGSVDRVDTYNKDGLCYIRVIDYKTGTKSFSLSDVYYGLNMQLLLYLFSVCEKGEERYGPSLPAAVLYMPGDPSAPDEKDSPEQAAQKAYRMDGLVLDDPDIIRALEREAKGVFLPVSLGSEDGAAKGGDKLASLERLGRIRRHIEKTVLEMAQALSEGDIAASPAVKGSRSCCEWCDYQAVCRRDRAAAPR
ncbi:MAG: PD-(D/E)XK nuclease family protein, partial [Oscillospiraceae bacterium]|nr:PD-(D/E)XK nuclease family protein [Oscillospiraceae bacterium]